MFRGKRFLVHRMKPVAGTGLEAGVLDGTSGELLVGAAEGTLLRLDEVQVEGKPKCAGTVFARDFQLKPGEKID